MHFWHNLKAEEKTVIIMDKWYKIIPDVKYCSEILELFCDLHDYIIENIKYDYNANTIEVFFEYDTHREGVILRFKGIDEFHIIAPDRDAPHLSGAKIIVTTDNHFLWYNDDSELSKDEIKKTQWLTWIQAIDIHFAFVNIINGEKIIEALSEEQINPIWHVLNYDTMQYQDIQKHFTVYEL